MTLSSGREQLDAAHAWPFEEARKVVARVAARRAAGREVKEVLFETGYGPSGLPHIGTFGEVARTSWVRQAFEALSDVPTRLVAFSDDMDGLRKVPDNVPNQDMLGTGQRPFYLLTPQHIHVGDQLESRVINLATSSNAIQLVGLGLRPDTRKKIT